MSLTAEAITALTVLVERYEQLSGRPCDLASRLVLSYAAKSLVEGRCVGIRAGATGVLVEIYKRKAVQP